MPENFKHHSEQGMATIKHVNFSSFSQDLLLNKVMFWRHQFRSYNCLNLLSVNHNFQSFIKVTFNSYSLFENTF